MPGESSRINGRKGGRPKGSENEQTKIRRMMQKRWIERIYGYADQVFEAHLVLAMGYYEERVTEDGIQCVYRHSPNPRALEWIMEHIWGKAPEHLSTETDLMPTFAESVSGITPETQIALREALRRACPKGLTESSRIIE